MIEFSNCNRVSRKPLTGTKGSGIDAASNGLSGAKIMDLALETSLISAGTSLVVLTIGQVLTPIIRDSMTKKKEAQYLAIRVVCILDKFVEDCASTAIDDGQEDNEGHNRPQVTAPDPPTYPSDVNWKSIKPVLMYKLLALPATTERAANYVEASSENAFPPDYGEWFQARTESYSSLGLQAHDLVEALRKEYDMPPAEYLFWDPVDRMRHELKKIKDWHRQSEHGSLRNLGNLVRHLVHHRLRHRKSLQSPVRSLAGHTAIHRD